MSDCIGEGCNHSSHEETEPKKTAIVGGRVLTSKEAIANAIRRGSKVIYAGDVAIELPRDSSLQSRSDRRALKQLVKVGEAAEPNLSGAKRSHGKTTRSRNPGRWKKIKRRRSVKKGARPREWYESRGLPVPKHSSARHADR